jgi:hypothetical protein
MAENNLLAQIVDGVRGAQSAFQSLYSAIRVSDSEPKLRDLTISIALDISLQSLGSAVENLNRINARGSTIDIVLSTLTAQLSNTASGHQTSVADAMIADMHNLEQHLTDVLHDVTTANKRGTPASVRLLPPEEVISIQGMVEKYRSMISEVSDKQTMCVKKSYAAV